MLYSNVEVSGLVPKGSPLDQALNGSTEVCTVQMHQYLKPDLFPIPSPLFCSVPHQQIHTSKSTPAMLNLQIQGDTWSSRGLLQGNLPYLEETSRLLPRLVRLR